MTGLVPTCGASASTWCWDMGDGVQGPGWRTRHDYTPRDPSMVMAAQGIWAGGSSETWRQDGHLRAGAGGKSLAVLGARGATGQRSQRDSGHTPLHQQQQQGEMEPTQGSSGPADGSPDTGTQQAEQRLRGFELRPSSWGGQAPSPSSQVTMVTLEMAAGGKVTPGLGWAGRGQHGGTTVMLCLGLRGRETAGEAHPGRGRGEPCPPCLSLGSCPSLSWARGSRALVS